MSTDEFKVGKRSYLHVIDQHDMTLDESHIGDVRFPQTHYLICRSKLYRYDVSTQQISRIKYNPATDRWLGIELEQDESRYRSNPVIVPLPAEWIRRNFTEPEIAFFKQKANEDYNSFIECPVQDKIIINPKMDISRNPYLVHTQNERGVCAFASFASVLCFYGMKKYGSLIMNLANAIDITKSDYNCILQLILRMINFSKDFKQFRKQYEIKRIDNSHDLLLYANPADHDMKLVVLKQSDNHISHAVTITKNFIFDCNASNALPLTRDGLNTCCGETACFESIKMGYWFQKKDKQIR
jgi:hypothetical protein